MFRLFKRWSRRRTLQQRPINQVDWDYTLSRVPLLAELDAERQAQVRAMATWFVDEKDFYPSGGLEINEQIKLIIAAQACLPVVDIGYEWLDGWYSIYLYPGLFRTRRSTRDHNGLVSEDGRALSGEASSHGGIVLSWDDVQDDIAHAGDGENVIIHEIAHKLDMRNGPADGYPPLPRHMRRQTWAEVMQGAFDDLTAQTRKGQPPIDAYGATNPAEFFAVCSEIYFECPQRLRSVYPQVHEQLSQFYRNRATA